MALTAAEVQKYYLGFYGRPADPVGLAYWMTQDKAAADAGFAASAEYAALYSGMTVQQRVNQVYKNVLGRDADPAGLLYWSAELTAGRVTTANLVTTMMTSALEPDVTTIANRITYSTAFTAAIDTTAEIVGYSGDAAAAAARAAMAPITTNATLTTAQAALAASVATVVGSGTTTSGQTYTLTTSFDNFPGTSGNDIFNGIAGTGATSVAGDAVNGGEGTDTFRLYTDGAVVLPGTMTSIEALFINDTIHQNTDISTATMKGAGIKTLTLDGGATIAAGEMTITTTTGQSLTLQNMVDGDAGTDGGGSGTNKGEISLTVAAADTAALAAITSMDLTVKDIGASATADDIEIDVTATGITTLNLTATGTNSYIELYNTGAKITTLNIAGAGGVTIGSETAMPAALKTVSAASATGAVSVSFGTNVSTFTGGKGNDTIIFTGTNFVGAEDATAANRDTVNGGDGTDTLSLTIADAVAASTAAQTTVTNIEALTINDAAAGTFDATKFSGVTKVTLAAGADDTNSITVAAGSTLVLGADSTTDAITTVSVGGTGTSDAVTIEMAGYDWKAGGTAALATSGVETLNINSGLLAADTAVIAGTTTMTATAGGTANIVVTGAAAMTFTGVVTAASIDASNLTGVLTITGTPANAISIKGGSKADAIKGSTANDVLVGNAGNDTITGQAGNDVITGGSGADNFTFSATTANGSDTITDFKHSETDIINLDACVGTGTAVTVAAPAAAVTTTSMTDFVRVVSTDGTAGSITVGGTATLSSSDFTASTLTNVAAFMAAHWSGVSSTTGTDVGVFVVNYTASGSTTSYIYQWDNDGTANVVQAGELALIGTVTRDAALVVADLTYA